MKILVSAKNVQKAIEQGLKELGVKQDEVDIKILDEGGLFRKAKVELILEGTKEESFIKNDEELQLKQEAKKKTFFNKENKKAEKQNKKQEKFTKEKADFEKQNKKVEEKEKSEEKSLNEVAQNFLNKLFEKMGVEAQISFEKTESGTTFNASGEKVSMLIGKRGETLNAIQEILSNIVRNAGFREERVFFDVENYKTRREASLANLAERMAKKALKIEKPIKLERMNAYERKIIHTALQSIEGVTTKSEGEEPNRYLIIIPTKKDK